MARRGHPVAALLGLLCCCSVVAAGASLRGTILDPAGAAAAGATVTVINASGTRMAAAVTDQQGSYEFVSLPHGQFRLYVEAGGFEPVEMSVTIPTDSPLLVRLALSAPVTSLTVSATRSAVEDSGDSVRIVNVVERQRLQEQPLPTIAAALQNQAGVMVQTTGYGAASPFLRGLTGYQTLILMDGIRYNSSIFRSGPNQYLGFVDPSQIHSVEAVLGPTSAAYGSDSLGGTLALTSTPARFDPEARIRGEINTQFGTADMSAGGAGRIAYSSPKLWLLGGAALRRRNDLRAGGGLDSHHVFRRYFGLPLAQIRELTGGRLQDTGFGQYAGEFKAAWRPTAAQSITARYQRSDLVNVRAYRDTWGGLGRQLSLFDPQTSQFAYLRYERSGLGAADTFSATASWNQLDDTNVRRGMAFPDPLTRDEVRSDTLGVIVQGATHVGRSHAQLFGADYFGDFVTSFSNSVAVTGAEKVLRGLVPNGSKYGLYGVFAQNSSELFQGRLRLSAGGRFTVARFETFARRNVDGNGKLLGVADSSQRFDDLTFNASAAYRIAGPLSAFGLVSRGFRAPNTSDLGTVGLSGQGYEVPSASAVAAGALLSDSSSETAVSLGRRLTAVRPETLMNYEAGLRVRTHKLYARAQGFWADFGNPIQRRTLLFAKDGAPDAVDGYPVAALPQTATQAAQGVVMVAYAADPRALKTFVNDGKALYYGLETSVTADLNSRWRVESSYTYLNGRTLYPNRAARRLPPQHGYLALRFRATGRLWLELSGQAAGRQDRLPTGDLDDERIGASRRRSDIASFFNSALNSPFVAVTAGGAVFTPTGETLRQIQDRVLPLGTTIHGVVVANDNSRVPLVGSTPGWFAAHVKAGYSLTEWSTVVFGVMNAFDANYRVHGSGVDMPGRNIFVGWNVRF